MFFSLLEAPEHKNLASESTFLLINLENFYNTKVAYDNFSHKKFIFDSFLIIFMTKIMDTAKVVKIADFTFRHVCTNKISLKVGSNLSFSKKNLLGTLKLTHLLYKK